MDERIEQLKIDILRNKPFFGYVVPRLTISKMSPLYEKLIGTACIDARGNIEYSEAWFKTLTDEQIIGVLCHELLHYVLHHFTRAEGFNKQVANIAQDLVINDILYNLESMRFMRMSNTIDFNNTKTPKQITGICPDSNGKFYIIDVQQNTHTIDVRNENWETVYYRIIKLFDDLKLSGIKLDKNPGEDGSGQGIPQPLNEYGNFDGHVWIELSEDEQKQIEEQTNDQFAEAVTFEEKQNNNKQRGISDSWQQRILDNIAKPQVNWKTMLRRAIRKLEVFDFTYNKLNKRSYSYGYAMPTLLKDSVQCTLAIDVSGSISSEELSKFFAEFKGIINSKRNVKVRLLYWSTKVDKKTDITYTRRDFPKAIEMSKSIKTTYGTEISCVAKYLTKNPGDKDSFKTIIYLTDGYIEECPSFPPNSEIIFVIPSDGTDAIVKNFGKVIRIV